MIELIPDGVAHGGEVVGRHEGKAVFVAGALPGERIAAEIEQDSGSWARARLVEVLDPSPERTIPPCPFFGECGGCDWQFASYQAQLTWKQRIVEGQLRHLGRLTEPPVMPTLAPGPAFGYRNRLDLRVEDGRPALHRRRSSALVAIDDCLLAADPIRQMVDALGDLTGADRVTLRAGIATGDTLMLVEGRLPAGSGDWPGSVVVGQGRRRRVITGRPYLEEEVAGIRFRVSAPAFFQVNTAGAGALVELVESALEPGPDDLLVDAYAGGGLFATTVGRRVGRITAIEQSAAAAADLRHNLAAGGLQARVLQGDVERGSGHERPDIVVCDPPRRGLGRGGVAALTRHAPRAIAYVSCDPASLARDARLLVEAGYQMKRATPVDMFPQTHHIETVAEFRRSV